MSKWFSFDSTRSIKDRGASFNSTQRRKGAKAQSLENLLENNLRHSNKNASFFKFVCLKGVFKQTNSKNNTFFSESLRSCCERLSKLCAFAPLRLCVESKLNHLLKTLLITSIILMTSCNSEHAPNKNLIVHEICARVANQPPVYRVTAPKEWLFTMPDKNESLEDTKKALCEFLIKDDLREIRITIHNFPSISLEERIPITAQIMRWKRQFDNLDSNSILIKPQSFAGFVGAFFEATGEMGHKQMTLLSWCMQIAPVHYRKLNEEPQRRADFTIKVLGEPEHIEENRKSIIAFARSFELLNEI